MRAYFLLLCLIGFSISSCNPEIEEEIKNDYLFNKLSSKVSGVDFVNEIHEDPSHNIINYIYYYNGGGVAVERGRHSLERFGIRAILNLKIYQKLPVYLVVLHGVQVHLWLILMPMVTWIYMCVRFLDC